MYLNKMSFLPVILSLIAILLAVPQLSAQTRADGGMVSGSAIEAAKSESEPDRSVPQSGVAANPITGKVPQAGNLLIVYFEEPALVHYMGDIQGMEATSPLARGERKLDAQSPASQAYLDFLGQRQTEYVRSIGQVLSRPIDVVYQYRAHSFGIAVKMTRGEGKAIENLPGVVSVVPDRIHNFDTDRGPTWIGAPSIWDGTATGGLPGNKGEGIVVGVIDTGINMDHPSFAAAGGDGYTHINPNGSGTFIGWCDPTNPNHHASYVCNDKLIGAWDYTDAYCAANPGECSEADGPEDGAGHGSHTSSTAAGNVLLSPAISGVAPHANIIMYDACHDPSCPFTATSAAADQALLDGVDVINYSIGGGGNPWVPEADIDGRFLNLVQTGTLVAASAGNSGPGAGTVGHLGPWVATVASSTHDLDTVENHLTDMTGGTGAPSEMTGASRTTGYGPATIVYAQDYSNGDPDPEQCLNPFPGGTWTSGEIVLCDRGTIARVLKCANVAAGGAAGCVLANVTGGTATIVPDPHVIPATHISAADGDVLRAWLNSAVLGTTPEAMITDSTVVVDPLVADILASSSSRGPNNAFSALKPNLSAPGVNIFAAYNTDGTLPPPEFAIISGTSMASPHVAGSLALMRKLYPSWSPASIISAIMMTAKPVIFKEDGSTPTDPFDVGGGRVDLTKAALSGLVLDETYDNFLNADPALGGLPEGLNVPGLQSNACVIQCSWSRTFTSVADGSVTYNVTGSASGDASISANPSNFTIAPGAQQTVEFTADGGSTPLGSWAFGQATLTPTISSPSGGAEPALHLPAAFNIAEHNFPTEVTFVAINEVDSGDVEGLQYIQAITDLTVEEYGLAQGAVTDVMLDQDATNADPYDDLSQVFWKTIAVPLGALNLVAATESAEAPDVDLFVGTGPTPSAGTQVCASTTATATEFCQVANPAAGTWWILVQNWAGSTNQPDLIELVDGVVPGVDNGDMTVTGPATVAAGTPFDVNVAWDLSGMSLPEGGAPGRLLFGAFSLAKDDTSEPIQNIFVKIEFQLELIFADDFEGGNTDDWSNTTN